MRLCQAPPLFVNLVGGSPFRPLPQQKEGRCTLCNWISKCGTLDQKKVVLFPEISHVENFYLSRARVVESVSEYIFFIWKSKKTSKRKKNNKKRKGNYRRNDNISGKSIKKKLQPPRWRFFSPPAFPETRVFFVFLAWCWIFRKKIIKIKYSRSSLDTENSRYGHQQPYNLFSAFDNFRALTDNSGKRKSVDSKQKN